MINVPMWPQDFKPEGEDVTNKAGAERLAATIERAWLAAGHGDVHCQVEPLDTDGKAVFYGVRSNLVRGLPPSATRRVISKGIGR